MSAADITMTDTNAEELGVRRGMHLLARVEVDGRSISFGHGLLICHPEAGEDSDCWHVMLLRVPPEDELCANPSLRQRYAVLAITVEGRRYAGCARPLPFRSAPDCLRLIGTSSLLSADERAGSSAAE